MVDSSVSSEFARLLATLPVIRAGIAPAGDPRLGTAHCYRNPTNFSASGPVRYGQFPCSIGVLEAPDKFMPIGMASGIGRTEGGLGLWELTVHGVDVPGRWVITALR
jgi:hypothetical protein